jgi:hypothetical protein
MAKHMTKIKYEKMVRIHLNPFKNKKFKYISIFYYVNKNQNLITILR